MCEGMVSSISQIYIRVVPVRCGDHLDGIGSPPTKNTAMLRSRSSCSIYESEDCCLTLAVDGQGQDTTVSRVRKERWWRLCLSAGES